MVRFVLASTLLMIAFAPGRAVPPIGYSPKVAVSNPTRLDWTFAVSNRSLANPPPDFLPADYDSAKQSYELFLPQRRDPKQPIGAIIFISTADEPSGWKSFEPTCKQLGLAFIGVRGAGNNVASPLPSASSSTASTRSAARCRSTLTGPTSPVFPVADGSRAPSGSRSPSISAASCRWLPVATCVPSPGSVTGQSIASVQQRSSARRTSIEVRSSAGRGRTGAGSGFAPRCGSRISDTPCRRQLH